MTSAAAIPNASLNDDNTIPVLGIGTGELSEAEAEHAVSVALEIGVRLIDTAAAYGNEAAVGRAIAASGLPRAEIFVTTKLATEDQGYQASQDALKVASNGSAWSTSTCTSSTGPPETPASTSTASAV